MLRSEMPEQVPPSMRTVIAEGATKFLVRAAGSPMGPPGFRGFKGSEAFRTLIRQRSGHRAVPAKRTT